MQPIQGLSPATMILFAIALSARTPWAAGDIAAEGGGFRSGHMSVDLASKCSCRLLHEHLDRHSHRAMLPSCCSHRDWVTCPRLQSKLHERKRRVPRVARTLRRVG